MTMFDLALKNIKHNVKSYGLYIGATVFSIIIYFTFAILKYSEEISDSIEASRQLKGMMGASAFVLMIFVAIFILYSNTFFLKKRKKEIALYSLLGVRKRAIGFLLFFENIVIGFISLIIGIALGFVCSQLLLIVLLKMMGLEGFIGFTFSLSALTETIVVFAVIFIVTSLISYRVIYTFKLIDLFHAEKKGEKEPKARFIIAILGCFTLYISYSLALADIITSKTWEVLGIATPLVIIGLTVIGSYLIFNSMLVYLLRRLKNFNRWAWKGLNMMTASQLLYRIRANARTLTIIAILSATTITAGGAVFGMYYNIDKNVAEITPLTFMWESEQEEKVNDSLHFEVKEIRLTEDEREMTYNVMKQSDVRQIAMALGWNEMTELAEGKREVIYIDPFYDERWSEQKESFSIDDRQFDVVQMIDNQLLNLDLRAGSILVLANSEYESLTGETVFYEALQLEDYKGEAATSAALQAQVGTESFSSAVELYETMLQSSGVQLFIGSFLGLVFLVATGSIIFFKMMTEAEEDKGKYEILYKIGVAKQEIKRTVRQQMAVVFIAPLLLGLLHGAIALLAFSNLLQMNLLLPIIIWMFAYTVIYIIYYFGTSRSFYKTVTKGRF